MSESVIQRAFAAGELAPVLHSRADLVKYAQGLRTCLNFIVRREGGVQNRAGLRFVQACKTDTYGAKLMRFVGAEAGDSHLIEMGAGYMRFFKNGAPVVIGSAPAYNGATEYHPGDLVSSGGAMYVCIALTTGNAPPNVTYWHALPGGQLEIPTDYTLGTLPSWNQSGNVITLTSLYHRPQELVSLGANKWVLRAVSTTPAVAAPQSVVGTPAGAGTRTFRYKVTAAATGTYEESNASSVCTVASTIAPTEAAAIGLTWTAQPGAAEFYVYCDPYGNGVFGYVGTAAQNSFQHAGQIPDFNLTPSTSRTMFEVADNYPATSANYQQRRYFANTITEPDSYWGSRIGFPLNFGVSSPIQDDDSVTFRLAGNNYHPIRWLVALKAGLILLTDGGEWTVTGGGGPKFPITPSSINADQETYTGVHRTVRPVVVGNAVLYLQARGSVLRELKFDQEVEGLAGRDLCIFATHLFERRTILGIDYQQIPHSVIWCVRSDGVLLGLTYIPDQEVWGWHRHVTQGQFEEVCVVPEAEADTLYVIVKRTVRGVAKRYIEKLEIREALTGYVHASSFFVDSGLSYSGPPADQFAGLGHLEGMKVAVYADGQAVCDGLTADSYVVSAGMVTLPAAHTNVHIGLNYTAQIEMLDLDVEGSTVRTKQKRVSSVDLLVDKSSRTFQAAAHGQALRWFEGEPWLAATDTASEILTLNVPCVWDKPGRVLVQQSSPLPLCIIGVMPNVDIGG